MGVSRFRLHKKSFLNKNDKMSVLEAYNKDDQNGKPKMKEENCDQGITCITKNALHNNKLRNSIDSNATLIMRQSERETTLYTPKRCECYDSEEELENEETSFRSQPIEYDENSFYLKLGCMYLLANIALEFVEPWIHSLI